MDMKTGEGEETHCSLNNDRELAEKLISETASSKFKFLLGRIKAEKQLPSDSKQQLISKRCIQQSLLQSEHVTDHRIPKYLRFVNLDEKFLQHCLDLVEFRAANSLSMICSPAVPCNVAVNLRSSKQVFYDNHLEPHRNMRRNRSDLGNFVVHCPSATRSGQWILKTVDENKCGKNVLNDSLLRHLGALGSIVMRRVGLIDVKGTKDSGFMSFPSRPSLRSLQKPETGTAYVENPRSGSKSLNKHIFAISNGVSTSSDQSLSSSATFSQGTLQREWENGVPYFKYSVDDQRVVYVSKTVESEFSENMPLDCVYLFYKKKVGGKEKGTCDKSLDLAGKMNVTSSLTLCSDSDNSKVMETQCVLFGADAKEIGNIACSDHILGRTKVSVNKMVDVFRPKHLPKHNSCSQFGTESYVHEHFSWEADTSSNVGRLGAEIFQAGPPNVELAAIVLREQTHDSHQATVVGGWGLKFLQKARVGGANTSQVVPVSSEPSQESRLRGMGDCSTSMNVIIPAGAHGGPRTRNGGPSSLTERWQSGGHCDCGGWDIGCPLTVLTSRPSKEIWTNTNAEGEHNSLDLIIEGSRQGVPPSLEMVNVGNGTYNIQFQSSLSALQSFSVGVAIIHTQSHSHITKDALKQ